MKNPVKNATHDILHDQACSDITFSKLEAFIHYVEKRETIAAQIVSILYLGG